MIGNKVGHSTGMLAVGSTPTLATDKEAKMKRYYWLKLKEDFFETDTIRWIEEQPNGIIYSNFYLKLCLKSLKTYGKLIRFIGDNYLPYDDESLSKLTGVDIDTVRCAMALLTKIGLIKILETGELYLDRVEEMLGSESDKAEYYRDYRQRKRLKADDDVTKKLQCDCNANISQSQHKTDIDIDIDIDKDIDNIICDSNEPPKTKTTRKKFIKPTIEEISAYCAERNNNIDSQQFYDYYEANGWRVGKNPMKDWKACIRTWERNSFNNKKSKIDPLDNLDLETNPFEVNK